MAKRKCREPFLKYQVLLWDAKSLEFKPTDLPAYRKEGMARNAANRLADRLGRPRREAYVEPFVNPDCKPV